MDRSFQSSFSVKSPFSPRSRQNISSKRIIPPSFRKSSRLSVSGKSTQSVQIVLKSAHNYVERFGQPLPVLITEALTFADRNTVVSARISECGYAWVVCGRRLLIWQYRTTSSAPGTPQRKHGGINQCFELQLPQSDLAHRAELVSVFIAAGSNAPSCIAVSPEGVLRYWPAVVHEGVTVEQTVDLQGQECDSLTGVEGLGCILATTTCTVVLVQPQVTGGRHVLQCKPLRTPSGWLGGISKRMSSLIFGPISNEHSSETRLVRVLSVPNSDGTWIVYVLAGHSLQKWILSTSDAEQLVSVAELHRLVRDSFHAAVWDNCVGDQAEIDTWLLDIQSDKDNIIVLAAAVNMQMSPQVHYAMISFSTNATTQIRDFLLLKMSGLYREDKPSDSLSYRFLLCGTNAYLYNLKTITVVKPQEEPDTLEFNSSQDLLLGGSICVNTPIFFSRINGLVTVSSNEQLVGDYMNLSMMGTSIPVETFSEMVGVNNLSVYNMDPDEIFNAYKDTVGQLKAAFIFHIRNQQSSTILGIDSTLDKVVVLMCKDLLDDIPAGDPRWNKDAPLGIGSSYSMQVLHQLEDKQKALSLYLKFLKDSGLWNRLSACNMRDMPTATESCPKKITAAIVLKSLPNSLILENAIEKAIEHFESEPGNGLTNQDIFYREVSKVHRGIQELVTCCEDSAHSDLNPAQVAQIVHDTNEIVLTVLNEVIQYRNQNIETFIPSEEAKLLNLDYLPWTAANGVEGVADALLLQHALTFGYGLKLTSQGQLRNSLLDHFVALTDLVLDGRKCHLESIKNTPRENILYKQYCSDRHKLIKPLSNIRPKLFVAADTLHNLAREEAESLTRQKTMLSLSKLAKLAGPNTTDSKSYIENINSHLELITFQEDLPDYVLQEFGYDTLKPRVIPPKDLVHLYICNEYTDAGELEFKKALDILPFIEDEELREELHLKIWRSAILRDSWTYKNLDYPLEILQGTLFFRLVDLSIALGANPNSLLPPLDTLTEDQCMQDLQDNKNFQFLIKPVTNMFSDRKC
ncbi:hypothetical protein NQ314_010426 [Rhamnusium bicolor]|uniref:Nucleoporin Nup133/Nup155-like N-terminal domain-containing protein n=1 Tax=Rhamnusium bicolor TaxID=1586634 RepID=A0AAV8XQR8_9CUCU|nr:hypothetical protein NQ314_010426 [Rhamnusium bicolor]